LAADDAFKALGLLRFMVKKVIMTDGSFATGRGALRAVISLFWFRLFMVGLKRAISGGYAFQ